MAEINKEKSAARLVSLQKVAAADRSAKRLETLKKCAEARTEAMKQAQVAPAVAKPVAPASTNATSSVGTRLLQDVMKNPLKGAPMPGALQQLRQRQKAQAAMKAKMAEDRREARLAALKKCAAADRSAARRRALGLA